MSGLDVALLREHQAMASDGEVASSASSISSGSEEKCFDELADEGSDKHTSIKKGVQRIRSQKNNQGRSHRDEFDVEQAEDHQFDPGLDEPIMDEQEEVPDAMQMEKDKKAVYKHPLFPLLALLLEKCEHATATLSLGDDHQSSSVAFNEEIQEFVKHQERDGKPFLSDDPEVDALMIKAIQVLRIHLLELEKVQELCKDFCQRYITCLRTKMNSENLLRGTTGMAAFEASTCSSADEEGGEEEGEEEEESGDENCSLASGPSSTFPCAPAASTAANATNVGSAHPAQRVYDLGRSYAQGSGESMSHHSISSQYPGAHQHRNGGGERLPGPRPDSGNEGDLSDDAGPGGGAGNGNGGHKKSQKRGILPKQATSVMRSWLFQHIVHPYPTEDEKRTIAGQTNLTLLQVNNWFINARRRILQPMLDSANALNTTSGSSSSAKAGDGKETSGGGGQRSNENGSSAPTKSSTGGAKKLKTGNKNPSLQRFWPESLASAIQKGTPISAGSQKQSAAEGK